MGDRCSSVENTRDSPPTAPYTALLLCLLHWFRVRLVPRHLRTTFQSSYQPRNKAWQVSVNTSASRSSMCASFFPSFFFPTDGPEPFAITSPHTALPHAPPPILHLAPPRPHLLQHRIHALRAHRCRSHRAPAPLSRHIAQPATEPSIPASSRLVLRSPKLPWVVAVGPIGSPPTFFIGKGNGSARRRARRRSRTSPCSRRALEYLPTRHYLQQQDILSQLFGSHSSRFGPCSLHSLIVLYYLSLCLHDRDKSLVVLDLPPSVISSDARMTVVAVM